MTTTFFDYRTMGLLVERDRSGPGLTRFVLMAEFGGEDLIREDLGEVGDEKPAMVADRVMYGIQEMLKGRQWADFILKNTPPELLRFSERYVSFIERIVDTARDAAAVAVKNWREGRFMQVPTDPREWLPGGRPGMEGVRPSGPKEWSPRPKEAAVVIVDDMETLPDRKFYAATIYRWPYGPDPMRQEDWERWTDRREEHYFDRTVYYGSPQEALSAGIKQAEAAGLHVLHAETWY